MISDRVQNNSKEAVLQTKLVLEQCVLACGLHRGHHETHSSYSDTKVINGVATRMNWISGHVAPGQALYRTIRRKARGMCNRERTGGDTMSGP